MIDRDEAERRFRSALTRAPAGFEKVAVRDALGRVLADNVMAHVDVPSFDRSSFDGYAVRAVDTQSANELVPGFVELLSEFLEAGVAPAMDLGPGQAVGISSGSMLPRGADAVLMVAHAAEDNDKVVVIRRSITPDFEISFAGTDIAIGETVLRCRTVLTSRETGVLAALGEEYVDVFATTKRHDHFDRQRIILAFRRNQQRARRHRRRW